MKIHMLTLVRVAADEEEALLSLLEVFSHALSLSFSLQLSTSLSLTLLKLVHISAVVVSLCMEGCAGDVIWRRKYVWGIVSCLMGIKGCKSVLLNCT